MQQFCGLDLVPGSACVGVAFRDCEEASDKTRAAFGLLPDDLLEGPEGLAVLVVLLYVVAVTH